MKKKAADNYFVVMEEFEDGDIFNEIVFRDLSLAVKYCTLNKVPHFFEMSPENPFEPVNLCVITNGGFMRRRWVDVVRESEETCEVCRAYKKACH